MDEQTGRQAARQHDKSKRANKKRSTATIASHIKAVRTFCDCEFPGSCLDFFKCYFPPFYFVVLLLLCFVYNNPTIFYHSFCLRLCQLILCLRLCASASAASATMLFYCFAAVVKLAIKITTVVVALITVTIVVGVAGVES